MSRTFALFVPHYLPFAYALWLLVLLIVWSYCKKKPKKLEHFIGTCLLRCWQGGSLISMLLLLLSIYVPSTYVFHPLKNTNLLLPPTAAQLHRLKDAHKLSQSCLVSIMTTVITIMFSVTWWNIGENVYSSLSSSDPKCVPPTLARWGLSTTDILYQSMNSLAGNWLSEKLIKP